MTEVTNRGSASDSHAALVEEIARLKGAAEEFAAAAIKLELENQRLRTVNAGLLAALKDIAAWREKSMLEDCASCGG